MSKMYSKRTLSSLASLEKCKWCLAPVTFALGAHPLKVPSAANEISVTAPYKFNIFVHTIVTVESLPSLSSAVSELLSIDTQAHRPYYCLFARIELCSDWLNEKNL